MSLFKYFGERGGRSSEHRGPLQWPRSGDLMLPLRNTNQVALTEAEVEALEPVGDFHCQQFDLWDEKQLSEYCEIRDREGNGWYTVLFIDRKFNDNKQGWRVLLEWRQNYAEIPPSKVPFELRGPVAPAAVSLM